MSRSQHLSWNDAHFCGLRSQTNVYSLAKSISLANGRTQLIASSIDGHLATVEFENQCSREKLVPITSDEVLFPIVLNGNNSESEEEIEVVSMNVVPNWDHDGGNVLALTYLKIVLFEDEKAPQAFMNIYRLSETEGCCVEDPDSLIQQISLDFIPFKLSHHPILLEPERWENVLLLSGSDHKVHCYQPTDQYNGYEEMTNVEKFFPELINLDDNVTQLEMKQLDELHRLTAVGTQNGLICLYLVREESNEIQQSWTVEMDSPITSLHFFHQYTNNQRPDFLPTKSAENDDDSTAEEKGERPDKEALHLLATSAIDPSVVYHDVVTNGLSKCRVLPVSNSQDVVLCSCVMDVDFDGENEVLIGTYGQVLLVYKLIYEKPAMLTSTPFHTPMPVPIHATDTPILPCDRDNKPAGQEESVDQHMEKTVKERDVRRRHKTVAATCSGPDSSFHERYKEESSNLDVSPHQNLLSRLFRSQENLTSPSTKSIHFETPDKMLTPDLTIPSFAVTPITDYPCYKLIWTRRFCNPLMGLACDDVMGDGMMDLIVLTLKGLHILQPDLHEVAAVILNRLKQLCNGNPNPGPECRETLCPRDDRGITHD